jgi:hypothetical protein
MIGWDFVIDVIMEVKMYAIAEAATGYRKRYWGVKTPTP